MCAHTCVHTHTHIYISVYIYICMNICESKHYIYTEVSACVNLGRTRVHAVVISRNRSAVILLLILVFYMAAWFQMPESHFFPTDLTPAQRGSSSTEVEVEERKHWFLPTHQDVNINSALFGVRKCFALHVHCTIRFVGDVTSTAIIRGVASAQGSAPKTIDPKPHDPAASSGQNLLAGTLGFR